MLDGVLIAQAHLPKKHRPLLRLEAVSKLLRAAGRDDAGGDASARWSINDAAMAAASLRPISHAEVAASIAASRQQIYTDVGGQWTSAARLPPPQQPPSPVGRDILT